MKHYPAHIIALALLIPGCGGTADKADTTQSLTSQTTATGSDPVAEATGHPSSDLIPRTTFFGNPDKASPELSPDGKQLAYLAERDGVLNVWVAPVGDIENAKPVTADKTRPVRNFFWAHDNQHILYMQDAGGDENWHVFSVDTKTDKTLDLTPMDKIAARVSGVSDKHPESVVISINDRNPMLHDLYTVNIVSGEKKLLQENPGFVSMMVDDDYKVRIGTTMSADGGMVMMLPPTKARKPAKKTAKSSKGGESGKVAPASPLAGWTELMTVPQDDALSTSLLSFDKSGKSLYLWDSRDRDTSALTLMNLKTKNMKVITDHKMADGESVHFHPTTKKPLAASFNHARREWKILDKSVQKDFDKLKALSDGEANVISSSHDNNSWIVAYVDDDGPVKYYHWDRKQQKETFMFSNRKALESLTLSKMHARVIESRDGLSLVNYLSLPVPSDQDADGKPTQALPMVMLVHGGPWARDSWGYNGLHQLLTNRGYAVLSVNFRGSTGFGKSFTNAANKEWAGKMHDDLLDSVEWAINEGVAQKDKICIMGGSYGGYATLVGLTFTPETFACGIDIVGPSRIISLLEAIPAYWKPMQDLFKVRVGDWTTPEGRKMLEERSPLNKVNQIVRPLLIGQGANDPRVKQAEADQIVDAMKERDIAVSYVLFPDEGHGFRRPPNNLAFFAATEAFLSAHLGGKYQPVDPAEIQGTTMQVPAGAHGIPGFTALVDALAK